MSQDTHFISVDLIQGHETASSEEQLPRVFVLRLYRKSHESSFISIEPYPLTLTHPHQRHPEKSTKGDDASTLAILTSSKSRVDIEHVLIRTHRILEYPYMHSSCKSDRLFMAPLPTLGVQ